MGDRIGVVYRIRCAANGRCYIGSSVNMAARRLHHLWLLRRGAHHSRHLQRAYDKHGEAALVWEVIASVPVALLIEAETAAIQLERPAFNGDQPMATRLGAKQSASAKAKVSAANKGRKRSPEFRAELAARMLGNRRADGNQNARKVTPEIRVRINQLRADGLGCRRIAKAVSLSKKTVLNVWKGRH